jgi:hypothetical protein
MKMAKTFLAAMALSALTFGNGDGFAEKFGALPEAVRQTAEAHMENALPVSIGSVKGEQGWDYQINTRVDGKYHDLIIDEKGTLKAVKDETDLASVPAPAKAAIEKLASPSKILTVEKVTEDGQLSYGAIMKDDTQAKTVQVRVDVDGTVKSTTQSESGK